MVTDRRDTLYLGLTVSDAVRVFLIRIVADKQMPFALKVPNANTRVAMAEADEIVDTQHARFNTASELFDDIEKKITVHSPLENY